MALRGRRCVGVAREVETTTRSEWGEVVVVVPSCYSLVVVVGCCCRVVPCVARVHLMYLSSSMSLLHAKDDE
jgi:hypothetical protein